MIVIVGLLIGMAIAGSLFAVLMVIGWSIKQWNKSK